jgi:hypothetical protein
MIRAFSRQHVWFALFVLCVFATGIGAGLVVSRWLPPGPWAAGPRLPVGPPGAPGGVVERLARDLGLSDDQKAKVSAAFEKAHPQFDEFRKMNQAEFSALLQKLNSDVEAVLTEEQRARFRQMMPAFRGPRPGVTGGPGGMGGPPEFPGGSPVPPPGRMPGVAAPPPQSPQPQR